MTGHFEAFQQMRDCWAFASSAAPASFLLQFHTTEDKQLSGDSQEQALLFLEKAAKSCAWGTCIRIFYCAEKTRHCMLTPVNQKIPLRQN
jgi:hypothetical protein